MMTRYDIDDDEFDNDHFDEDQSDETTSDCPYCGQSIYGDAVRCSECGNYLSREDRPFNKPLWIIIGVLMSLLIVFHWIF